MSPPDIYARHAAQNFTGKNIRLKNIFDGISANWPEFSAQNSQIKLKNLKNVALLAYKCE